MAKNAKKVVAKKAPEVNFTNLIQDELNAFMLDSKNHRLNKKEVKRMLAMIDRINEGNRGFIIVVENTKGHETAQTFSRGYSRPETVYKVASALLEAEQRED